MSGLIGNINVLSHNFGDKDGHNHRRTRDQGCDRQDEQHQHDRHRRLKRHRRHGDCH